MHTFTHTHMHTFTHTHTHMHTFTHTNITLDIGSMLINSFTSTTYTSNWKSYSFLGKEEVIVTQEVVVIQIVY